MSGRCPGAGAVGWRNGLAAVLLLFATAGNAERLFVGILEADSYQGMIYGASAFSRVADLPMALELVQTALGRAMEVPSLSGVSVQDTLRIVQTIDPALPLGDNNPANVALVPLAGDGTAIREAFAAAYRKQTPCEPFTLFENPVNTNLHPRVMMVPEGRHLLTSTSREALHWAWKNRTHLLDAPLQSIPGTLRVLVNPQRFAELLDARNAKAAPLINTGKLLRDFETFSFSLTLDGQAFAVTVRGKPKAQTGLDALAAALRKPREQLWNGLPDQAFFAFLSACAAPGLWDNYLGEARFRFLRPYTGLAPQEAYSGDRLLYLASTKDGRGICFTQIEPVTQAVQVAEAIRRLHTAGHDDGIVLTPQAARRVADADVQTYAIDVKPQSDASGGKAGGGSPVFTLLSLFLKQAVLETAVARGHLITVLGPRGTIDDELSALSFPEKQLTLSRMINGQDPALTGPLVCGARLRVTNLLRHLVTIIPNVKPEQVRVLSAGGDGATFGVSVGTDHVLTASLRFHSNEIAALQRINRSGRAVLQELFFQMFAKQMMEMRSPESGETEIKSQNAR